MWHRFGCRRRGDGRDVVAQMEVGLVKDPRNIGRKERIPEQRIVFDLTIVR